MAHSAIEEGGGNGTHPTTRWDCTNNIVPLSRSLQLSSQPCFATATTVLTLFPQSLRTLLLHLNIFIKSRDETVFSHWSPYGTFHGQKLPDIEFCCFLGYSVKKVDRERGTNLLRHKRSKKSWGNRDRVQTALSVYLSSGRHVSCRHTENRKAK